MDGLRKRVLLTPVMIAHEVCRIAPAADHWQQITWRHKTEAFALSLDDYLKNHIEPAMKDPTPTQRNGAKRFDDAIRAMRPQIVATVVKGDAEAGVIGAYMIETDEYQLIAYFLRQKAAL